MWLAAIALSSEEQLFVREVAQSIFKFISTITKYQDGGNKWSIFFLGANPPPLHSSAKAKDQWEGPSSLGYFLRSRSCGMDAEVEGGEESYGQYAIG